MKWYRLELDEMQYDRLHRGVFGPSLLDVFCETIEELGGEIRYEQE